MNKMTITDIPREDIAQIRVLVGNERRLEGGLRFGAVNEWSWHNVSNVWYS